MPRMALLVPLLVAGLLAGCAEAEEPVVLPPAPAAPVPEDEPVDWTATIGSGVCATGSAVATFSFCGLSGPALTNPGAPASFEPTYAYSEEEGRDLAGGLLQLSWVAESIATEGLRVVATLWQDCPDECTVNRTVFSHAGLSPIEIPVDAHDLREGMAFTVTVMPADLTKGVALSIGQEVHLAGTLSFVEDVDGDPEEDEDEEDEEDDDEGDD